MNREIITLIPKIIIRSFLKQKRNNLHIPIPYSINQSSSSKLILRINIRFMLQQQLNTLKITRLTSIMQRLHLLSRLKINRALLIQKHSQSLIIVLIQSSQMNTTYPFIILLFEIIISLIRKNKLNILSSSILTSNMQSSFSFMVYI